jgi:hypothetical protein
LSGRNKRCSGDFSGPTLGINNRKRSRGIARPTRIKVKVLVSNSQTQARHQTTRSKNSRKPEWRPQPIGLTRNELREIVADMIG